MLKISRTNVGQTIYKRKYTYIYTHTNINVVILYFNVHFMIIIFIIDRNYFKLYVNQILIIFIYISMLINANNNSQLNIVYYPKLKIMQVHALSVSLATLLYLVISSQIHQFDH